MSQKQEKRARKMLREKMDVYGDSMKEMIAENSKIIKPKPRFIPLPIWMWMLGFFIKIGKEKKNE